MCKTSGCKNKGPMKNKNFIGNKILMSWSITSNVEFFVADLIMDNHSLLI